jgi:hypothetical protein
MIEFIPLRFFTGASDASATMFFSFLGFSALRSGVEAKLDQYGFQKKVLEIYIPLRFFAFRSFAAVSFAIA